LHKHGGIHRFVKHLIAFRLKKSDAPLEDPGLSLNELLRQARFQWHGVKLNQPDWGADSHSLAMTVFSITSTVVFHIMINAFWEELRFEIPPAADPSGSNWVRWIDTFRESPDDMCYWEKAEAVRENVYPVKPRSVVILVTGIENHGEQ
jgi:glycogen operon protein